MNSYLERLAIRLAIAMAELDSETRARHAQWLLARQREDGGFSGREGESDLYYTSFGLRGLSVLGELNGEPAERAATFLKGKLTSQQTIIDFLSLIYSGFMLDTSAGIDIFADSAVDWPDAVAETLELLRREDGGDAKGPTVSSSRFAYNCSSDYHPTPSPSHSLSTRRQPKTADSWRSERENERAPTPRPQPSARCKSLGEFTKISVSRQSIS